MIKEGYIHSPDLPQNKVSCVFVDYRVCEKSEEALTKWE